MTLYRMYSGGTKVTVYGQHLNSVAEPRITLTVVINRTQNNTNFATTSNSSDSAVFWH